MLLYRCMKGSFVSGEGNVREMVPQQPSAGQTAEYLKNHINSYGLTCKLHDTCMPSCT